MQLQHSMENDQVKFHEVEIRLFHEVEIMIMRSKVRFGSVRFRSRSHENFLK
jgi:hypothetical protein